MTQMKQGMNDFEAKQQMGKFKRKVKNHFTDSNLWVKVTMWIR